MAEPAPVSSPSRRRPVARLLRRRLIARADSGMMHDQGGRKTRRVFRSASEARQMTPKAFLGVALVAASVVTLPQAAAANPIERACLGSDRPAASRSLCRCIGNAADLTLNGSDMRVGARFFRDPGQAERVQLSDTARDDAFWRRWRQFAQTAEAMCS